MTFSASQPLRHRARWSLALGAAAFGLATAPADAAVTRSTISGPSANLAIPGQRVDVDVASDGTAAIAWRQKVGAVEHVFVSRYVGGAWSAPQRVDAGLATPSGQPAIAVAPGGKALVVFANGTAGNERLYAAEAAAGAPAFGGTLNVQLDPAGWKEPDLDIAANGDGYFTVYQGFHLRAYRVQGTTFTAVGAEFPSPDGILNGSPAEQADAGDQRGAHLAVDPTGASATLAWSETSGASGYKPWARKLTGTSLAGKGTAVDASIAALDGKPGVGGANDMTSVSVGGDGRAWIAYRAAFTYGAADRGRAITRTFDGSTLGTPQVVDGLGADATEAAEYPRIATNASGAGLAASYRQLTSATEAATLTAGGGAWTAGSTVSEGTNTSGGRATVALADSGVGLTTMLSTPGATKQVLGRISGGPAAGTLETLSDPAFGDAGSPYESGAGGGFAITAFTQGAAATSRIVAAVAPLPAPPQSAPPANTGSSSGNGETGNGGQQPKPTPAPALTKLKVKPKTLVATGSAPKLVTATSKSRTLSFSLDRAAAVDLTVKRVRPGKLVGATCKSAKGKSVRKKDRCDLETTVKGTATLQGAAGTNQVKFGGRASSGKPLAPGTYALYAVARDGAGASAPVRTTYVLKSTK